ncbi:MAG: hypothetical protein H0T67_04055, partial [Burkholderiaceae bacterium]|nr:hypothetical protein [Burkholderiaceae bacterium]
MLTYRLTRRAALGMALLPVLAGCSTPLPLGSRPPGEAEAARRLRESAEAHGLTAYRALTDVNVSYSGEWRPLIGRIQPELVDAGFRGPSEERLMPAAGIVAQAYTGPLGRKQVSWRRSRKAPDELGAVTVWFNGVRSSDPAAQDTAALVAEGYALFLLGPMWLVDRNLPMQLAGTERVDGRLCDAVNIWLSPGLGKVATDRLVAYVDRADSVTRRMRFTLEGFAGTRGTVAEVDTFDHTRRFDILWPMRSYERLVHPLPLPVHDWRITGL